MNRGRLGYGASPSASRRHQIEKVDSRGQDARPIDNVVSLCKRRGFVFPCGEIYGGTRSAWDYGPLGVELKENIKRQWWRSMVTARDDVVGLDSVGDPADEDLGGLAATSRRSPTR